MRLYYSPLACSMATRIALYEAGAEATFVEVDPKTKRTLAGQDYLAINPLGLVPAIELDSGEVLLENAAILQHVADLHPKAGIAPPQGLQRARLQQWLSFIGTELHKALFIPLFDASMPDATRSKTLDTGARRLDYLQAHLSQQDFLLDGWSVADAYLTTVLNWHGYTQVDLARWPAIQAYFTRMCARPATQRALAEEHELYRAEQRRHQAAA